jgi:hypothetical protein
MVRYITIDLEGYILSVGFEDGVVVVLDHRNGHYCSVSESGREKD